MHCLVAGSLCWLHWHCALVFPCDANNRSAFRCKRKLLTAFGRILTHFPRSLSLRPASCLSARLPACMTACQHTCMSACPSVYLSECMPVALYPCLPVDLPSASVCSCFPASVQLSASACRSLCFHVTVHPSCGRHHQRVTICMVLSLGISACLCP